MRFLVLSDIHADAAGLERALEAAANPGWDEVLVLGDLIGYGSEPRRTLELLSGLNVRATIIGNHENMLSKLQAGADLRLSPHILQPLEQCLRELSADELEMLTSLPDEAAGEGWQAVHGSPRSRFSYVLSSVDARLAEPHMSADLCLIGHTHLPGVFQLEQPCRWRHRPARLEKQSWELPAGSRFILNPGSVFLNRDHMRGGSYGLLDLHKRTFTVHRLLQG